NNASTDPSVQSQPAKPSPEVQPGGAPPATQPSSSSPAQGPSSQPSPTGGNNPSPSSTEPSSQDTQSAAPAQNQAPAQVQTQTAPPPPSATSFNQVVDRMVEREHFYVAQMRHMHPLVETYIQNMRGDQEMGSIPINDRYFLGRLDLSNGTDDKSFLTQP